MMAANIKSGKIKFWLPVLFWMGVIFFTSSIPGSCIPPLFFGQDVAYHSAIYLLLGFYFSRALKNTAAGLPSGKIILFTAIFGIIYGLTDEFHQIFVPLRSASVLDLLNDTLASLAGSLALVFWSKLQRRTD